MDSLGRWDSVLELLEDPPGNAVARALQTPLMVWLAGVVYERPEAVPDELAAAAASDDAGLVERKLLDRLVPGSGWRCTVSCPGGC